MAKAVSDNDCHRAFAVVENEIYSEYPVLEAAMAIIEIRGEMLEMSHYFT